MRIAVRRMAALLLATLVLPAFAISSAFAVVNTPPVAVDDTPPLIAEDAAATSIDVLSNDSDPDGNPLTIVSVTQGAIGSVVITGGGTGLTYQPSADLNGADSFQYTIDDGNGGQATATVNITVDPWNDAPSFTILGDQAVAEDAGPQTVSAFATGSPGPANESTQTLTYVIDGNTLPALFSAQPAIDGTTGDLTYTPAANANGSATITVHVVDNGSNGNGDVNFSPTQAFRISVTPVNDPPVAADDGAPYQVRQSSTKTVTAATGVLANDTDVEHSPLTAILDTNVAHGTLALHTDGSFTYTPTGLYVGTDSFTYHANDGAADSNIATVSLNVYVNHAPVAVADSATVVSGSGYVAIGVLTNDNAANPDPGEALTITFASDPAHGTVVITGGGTGLVYRPDSAFVGTDHFTYKVSDGLLTSKLATVTVSVPKDTYKPVTTAPVQTIGGQTIGVSTVDVRLAWTGSDKGSGVAAFELWRSVNGHTFTKVKTTTAHSALVTTAVGSSYRFRIRAIDKKGNVGAYAYGPKFTVLRFQETSASYTGSWPTSTSASYSGGHARYTTTPGASASFTTSGRTFTWVATRASTRSTADVYVDGVLRSHVSLASTTTAYHYAAWSITFATSGTHAVRIVFTGASPKRIDVDAFIVLR